MKSAICAALVLCARSTTLFASPETAYQALRVVSSQRGDDVLRHVINVEGRDGVPQPVVWRIVLDDPAARGGVREVDVAKGKIVAEHTPVRAYGGSAAGAVIDFQKLNLDSSGAFTVAEKEAQKAHVGFDSVDYTLRTGDGADATPVWVIQLIDASRHGIGSMSVQADNGSIVRSDLYGHHAGDAVDGGPQYSGPAEVVPRASDHDNLYGAETEPPVRREDDADTEDTQGLRIGHRIKTAILSAGHTLKNFITGHDSSPAQDDR